MKTLPPQRLKPAYYDPIESQIQAILYDILFRPLVAIAQDATDQMSESAHGMMNAVGNALQSALRSGKVQYEGGVFSGQFSAAIVSVLRAIGARWIKPEKVYKQDPAQVPGWVKAEAAAYESTARGAHGLMKSKLAEIERDLDSVLDKKEIHAKRTMREIQKDFRHVAEELQVSPELSEDSSARLAAAYNQNIKLYIKTFSRDMIGDLRTIVEKNATTGYRFDKLIPQIQGRYAVTQNKAKFLARQETGLFMAKYRQERFGEAGVTLYRWSTSHDERVRPAPGTHGVARQNNHRRLDGRVFAYADPPVVDTATGRRANPGEDFNCRCVDVPVLDRVAVSA